MHQIIITSGYFDPLHVGHIECFAIAKKIYPKAKLFVIVNNDRQAVLKKGRAFMPEAERLEIVRAIKYVDFAELSIDTDRTVCESLRHYFSPDVADLSDLRFIKGGDRSASEIPERYVCDELDIKIVDGFGEKIQSSSLLTGLREITLYPECDTTLDRICK